MIRIRIQIWALAAVMQCCMHTYAEEHLDTLFLQPLEPLWYKGQPYDACEAIINKFYGADEKKLNQVGEQERMCHGCGVLM